MTARTAFALCAAGYAGVLAWASTVLPARVPVHWSGSGGPDRVVDRGRALLELGLVGVGLGLLFAALAAWMPRVPIAWVNVPHKDYWSREENQPEMRRRLSVDMWGFGAGMMVFLALVVVQIVLVADDPDPRLGPLFLVSVVVMLALSLGYLLVAAVWRYRPERGSA